MLSSRRAPVLPAPLSTLVPSIMGTRSLIGTYEGLTMCPAKSCTAARSDASHVENEAGGDEIGKREKVAWVARDRQDKCGARDV